jgi:hypothetical protein
MKKRFGATKPLLLLLLLSVVVGAQERSPAVVFRDVTVIDMTGARPKPNMTVVVRGNRISEIGRRVTVPKNAEVVNAAGKFLIPGLWDPRPASVLRRANRKRDEPTSARDEFPPGHPRLPPS